MTSCSRSGAQTGGCDHTQGLRLCSRAAEGVEDWLLGPTRGILGKLLGSRPQTEFGSCQALGVCCSNISRAVTTQPSPRGLIRPKSQPQKLHCSRPTLGCSNPVSVNKTPPDTLPSPFYPILVRRELRATSASFHLRLLQLQLSEHKKRKGLPTPSPLLSLPVHSPKEKWKGGRVGVDGDISFPVAA